MDAAGFIAVKNFERFQHYKDRNPKWIKLYNEILDDYEFGRLPDASKWLAVGIWLLASRYENRIPNDPEWIGRRINARGAVDLAPLLSAGFITLSQPASEPLAIRSGSAMPEGEGERELETATGDKSPEAGPRDSDDTPKVGGDAEEPTPPTPPNSKPENPADTEELDLPAIRAQLAPAIRKHLWLGSDPPPLLVKSDPTWNMARELNTATGFIERGEATAEELIGAMEYVRPALQYAEVRPLSMLVFNTKGRRDRLAESVAYWRREQMRKRFAEHAKEKALEAVMGPLREEQRASA